MIPIPVQFITVSFADDPEHPQTLQVAQITNVVMGPGGKASIIGWNGTPKLTLHDYNEVIDKMTQAGILLDLRN